MTSDRMTPQPDEVNTDPLVAAYDNATVALFDTALIGDAESTVSLARQRELADRQRMALDRVNAARATLKSVTADGDQQQIHQAQIMYDVRCREFEELTEKTLPEMSGIVLSLLGHFRELAEGTSRICDAKQAVTIAETGEYDPALIELRDQLNAMVAVVDEALARDTLDDI